MASTSRSGPGRRSRRHAARRPEKLPVPTPGLTIDPGDLPTRIFLAAADALGRYHRHRVLHLERLARLFADGRRVVVVGNHALDIVDPLLFCATVYRQLGRVPRFIGHEKGWFRIPVLRDVSARFQVIASRKPEETVAALRRDGFLMLYPGANREAAMRSYRDEPYRLKWEGRMGYLRTALEADAEIVFVAAIGSDEMYYQSLIPTPERLIGWLNGGDAARYRGARLTFGVLGAHLVPGLFPWPVRLTHIVSEPIVLGNRERARRDPAALAALHESVWAECQAFLDGWVKRRGKYSDALDSSIRSVQTQLQRAGL